MSNLVDRQTVITLPVIPKEHREYQTFNLDDAYEQGWNDLQKCIETLPFAEGRWIRGDQEKLTGSQRCSVCGKSCYRDREYFNFCPHCGAYMRGERNEP